MPKHLTLLQRQKIHAAFLDADEDNQQIVDRIDCSVQQVRRYRKSVEAIGGVLQEGKSKMNGVKLELWAFQVCRPLIATGLT